MTSLVEEAELLVNYQLRVLKLLEAFVKRQSSSPWLVDLIAPLARLTYRDQTALAFRAADIVKRICKGKAPEKGSSAAVAALKDVMRLCYKGELRGDITHTRAPTPTPSSACLAHMSTYTMYCHIPPHT